MTYLAAATLSVAMAFSAFEYRPVDNALGVPFIQALSGSNGALDSAMGGLFLTAAGGRPYSLDEVDSWSVRAGYAWQHGALSASWKMMGLDGYREHVVDVNGSLFKRDFISLGITGSWYLVDASLTGFTMQNNRFDLGMGIYVQPAPWFRLGGQMKNFIALASRNMALVLPFQWSAGVALEPVQGIDLSWNGTHNGTHFINSVAVMITILKEFSIKAGFMPETESYQLAAVFRHRHFSVSYGFISHAVLGYTHSFSLTWTAKRRWPGSLVSSFQNHESSPVRVDVSNATEEELLRVRQIDSTLARRIILYRKKIGPVTRKAMVQLGMTEKDLREASASLTGFAHERKSHGRKKYRRYRKRIDRKKLYAQYAGMGMSAVDALDAVNACSSGDMQRLRNTASHYGVTVTRKVMSLCVR